MEQLKVKTKQYIDKDALIAEIDSILNETNYKPFTDEVLGERKVCKDIKDFINTLEVKEEVLDKNDKTKLMQKCVHKAYKRGYDMGVLLTTNEMNHNMKEVDLEKEYERYYEQEEKQLLLNDLKWIDMETNESHCYNCELFDSKNNVCKCIDLCKRPKSTYKGFYKKHY